MAGESCYNARSRSFNLGKAFELAYQTAAGPVVRRFDEVRIVLGRSMVCNLAFDSPHLSRKHAEIVREGGGWIIQDLHSRQGLTVNGQRVARQRLAPGDRITLAPDSPAPTLLEFRLPGPGIDRRCRRPWLLVRVRHLGKRRRRFGDESGPTSVVASIDLRQLSQVLDQSGRAQTAKIDLRAGGAGQKETADDESGGTFIGSASQLPILGLFKSAGEILLGDQDLAGMLQRVVDLIVAHLPGRRGAVCMVDPASGAIEPSCFGAGQDSKGGAARPFSISSSILQEAVRHERAMLVASAADDPRFRAATSVHQMGIRSAVCVPLYHQGQVTGVVYVDSQGEALPLNGQDLEVLTVLGLMVAAGIAQMALRGDVARERAMRDRLARYNSPQVVEQIMKIAPRQEDQMLADEYEVSVLFADLAGFTALAENWTAAEAVRALNLVFERWTANVFQCDGTLDKYIGDAVMAVFEAPLRQADHARRAVATALAMQQTLDDLNRLRPEEPALRMRVGINSGCVIAGDIGSPLHKSYTVIGDAVNVASRLETSVAQPGQIVIGPATYEQVRDDFVCESLGEKELRGKRQTIHAYRVLGLRSQVLGTRDQ